MALGQQRPEGLELRRQLTTPGWQRSGLLF
jgi:hypothetical protein